MKQTKKTKNTKKKKTVNNAAKSAPKNAAEKKKMFMIGGVVAGVALVAILGSYFALRAAVNKVPKDIICDNVYIETVDVSGMKAEEAKEALEAKVTEYQKMTVSLAAEEATVDVALADIGFDVKNMEKLVEKAVSYGKEGNVFSRYSKMKNLEEEKKVFEATYTIDTALVESVITERVPELENAAKDATITRQNGQFVITDEVKGVAIDTAESAKVIETYFNEDWKQDAGTIELVTMIDDPEVTREQLEQIQDVLGKYTTNCGTGGGRVQNIITGAKHINGAVIMPGEEYSADAAMRPYTYDNGFTTAGAYENGKVVQSMGGGICQVSSTLYNACLLAELEITQRQAHSMLVSYVEPSMDAAIAGDYKDLKFKNNTEAPIYVEGYVSGGYITFVIYGKETRAENRTVKYVSETISTTPAGKEYVASGDAIGSIKRTSSGYTGMKAQLWKVVYENGAEVSREVVNSSNYRSSKATYSVGTSSDNAAAAAIVKNAISSQNEATINAAIAQAKQKIADDKAAAQAPATPPITEAPSTPTPPPTTPENGTQTQVVE